MAITARPNLLTAMRSRLLTFSEVTSLVSSAAGWVDGRTEARVASQIHGQWKMPTRAIRLRRGGGPPSFDFRVGLWRARVDVFCYGGAGHEASDLVDIVFPVLCPEAGAPSDFAAGNCLVGLVEPEAEVFADVEPDSRWPFAWFPVSVLYRRLGLAA